MRTKTLCCDDILHRKILEPQEPHEEAAQKQADLEKHYENLKIEMKMYDLPMEGLFQFWLYWLIGTSLFVAALFLIFSFVELKC